VASTQYETWKIQLFSAVIITIFFTLVYAIMFYFNTEKITDIMRVDHQWRHSSVKTYAMLATPDILSSDRMVRFIQVHAEWYKWTCLNYALLFSDIMKFCEKIRGRESTWKN
jgi:hypothetical protein